MQGPGCLSRNRLDWRRGLELLCQFATKTDLIASSLSVTIKANIISQNVRYDTYGQTAIVHLHGNFYLPVVCP